MFGSFGPVVWYELVDDETDELLGWAPSHDPKKSGGGDEDGDEGSGGGRFVAEARHRRFTRSVAIVIVVRDSSFWVRLTC